MEQFIADNLSAYGPLAVFVLIMLSGFGLALGEDLIIIPAGMLVGTEHLPFWPTAIAAYFGVVIADIMWFSICYRYGTPLLHKRWFKRLVHPRRLLQVKHQIERRGAWMIVVTRFIPASRTTAITMAGMLHLPMWKFVLATATCTLVSTPLQLGVGVLISHGIGSRNLAEMIMAVAGVILLIIVLTVAYKWWQAHRAREQRAPRARVLWLKRFRSKRSTQSKLRKPSTKTTSL
jgi:membrane protein DedA with SNARE-associated domain